MRVFQEAQDVASVYNQQNADRESTFASIQGEEASYDVSFAFDCLVIDSKAYRKAFIRYVSDRKSGNDRDDSSSIVTLNEKEPPTHTVAVSGKTEIEDLIDFSNEEVSALEKSLHTPSPPVESSKSLLDLLELENVWDGGTSGLSSAVPSQQSRSTMGVRRKAVSASIVQQPEIARHPEVDVSKAQQIRENIPDSRLFVLACQQSDAKAGRALIEAGVDVEIRTTKDHTPLHIVCDRGCIELVDALVKAGADLEARNHKALTPLHRACSKGNTTIVEMLAKAGADIDAQDERGVTPLALGCARGHTDIVNILIRAGADVNAGNKRNHSPLYFACKHGHVEIMHLLIKSGANIEARDTSSQTVFLWACYYGQAGCIRLLIDSGADVSVKSRKDEGYEAYLSYWKSNDGKGETTYSFEVEQHIRNTIQRARYRI